MSYGIFSEYSVIVPCEIRTVVININNLFCSQLGVIQINQPMLIE